MPLKQERRMLALDTVLGADVLGVRTITVQEQLSRLFQIEAELSSEDGELDFNKLVGHNATIRLQVGQKGTRYFNAYISRFVQVANVGGYAHYRATLVPWFWFLTRTADCRIFQEKTVPEIVEEVFKVRGFSDYQLKLSASYPKREFCVQYRETDFGFVSRLLEEEGIYYFFTHENGKHTLVLADSTSAHTPFAEYEEIAFHELEKGATGRQVITDWVVEKEVQPIGYTLTDFDFTKPKASLLSASNVTRQHGSAVYEVFDYPGEYVEPSDGERLAGVRLDELQTQHETLRGQANARGLATGFTFKLKNHPRADQNREYLITSVSLRADSGEFASVREGAAGEFFACSFTAIDTKQQFRPPRLTFRPVVQGPQTALVVGPKGEEIHTDKYGRVKVKFHWDRYSKADENSSCWVRVSQAWAGKQWGAIYTPRVGQEVIVEFLEGDPDRPIITGRVYNDGSMPPYELPGEKTKSTLKSNSSKGGGGYNEIRFEDKKGSEQIYIHAQLDEDVRVNNTAREFIGNERHLIVKKKQFELVEEDKHLTVKGNRLTKIEGDDGLTVEGNELVKIEGSDNLKVAGDLAVATGGDASLKTDKNLNVEAGLKISAKAGTDYHVKAGAGYAVEGATVHIKGGMTVVIEGGVQVSLKVGGNFVDINPGGVFIQGSLVMINSGGAAGSGSGSSPTAPAGPESPDPPEEPKEAAGSKAGKVDEAPAAAKPPKPKTFSDSAQVLQYAAQGGSPLGEICPLRPPEPPPGEVEELPVITRIAWLDGADDAELGGDGIQWVNLPKEDKWVDAPHGVANKDRLSQKPRFKVTFSKPGSHSFKVKATPGDDNLVYTDAEKGRNANFKWMDQEKSYTTDGDGTKIVEADFFTPCGGNDQFKLVAEDTNNSPAVETGWLRTRRLVYAVVIKMRGMTNLPDLGPFLSEFRSHGIELVRLADAEIDRMANISTDQQNDYTNRCKTAFDGSEGKPKLPYAVGIGFTEHLAVKNPNQDLELTGVEVGPDKPAVDIPVQARGLRPGDGLDTRSLWMDLVPGESWFVSATYTPDGGGAAQDIPEAKCTSAPEGSSNASTVRVDVTGLPAGTGTIRVRVHVVDRMRAGLSLGGNLICICTKAWWEDIPADEQNSTAIHEMGHKIGMVCDGTGKLPDKVATQYTGKGHLGSHCHFGLPVLATYASSTGQCVMFGAVGTNPPTAFCENCAPAVKKMDLSAGWTP